MSVARTGSPGTPILQYWHSGDDAPAEIAVLLGSFRELNPGRPHRLFSEEDAEEFISAHFTARELAAFRACAVPAMQADYFRYCAVYVLGGIYADADFRCIRPLDSLLEPGVDGMIFRNPRGHVDNGFFAFRAPRHPLLRLALDVATANIERRAAERVNLVTGPWVFSSLSALHELGSLEVARERVAGAHNERLVRSATEAIGDFSRLTAAFERVRVAPLCLAFEWIAKPDATPAYKGTGLHWNNWNRSERSIFR